MLVMSLALYGNSPVQSTALVTVLSAAVAYFLSMYLYYGIARLAFRRHTYWLWGGAAAAVVLSFALIGVSGLWSILTGWSMLLVAGVLAGRLTLTGVRPRTIYISCIVTVTVFASAQYFPLWRELISSAPEVTETLVNEAEQQLLAMGESEHRIDQVLDSLRQLVSFVIRMAPAETVLGVILQFSVGYLLFVHWIDKHHLARPQWEPFIYWKIPFGVTPVVLVIGLVRVLGGDVLKLAADNTLLVMAAFYAVTGLSLLEYFQRKLQLSRPVRTVFYILLFIVPLMNLMVGLVLGAVISLIGFADSFADWRKIHLREFA